MKTPDAATENVYWLVTNVKLRRTQKVGEKLWLAVMFGRHEDRVEKD